MTVTDAKRGDVSGDQLTTDVGLDSEEIEWRKEFTRFGTADTEELESLTPLFDRVADDVVETFYEHIQTHPTAGAFVDRSSKSVTELEREQRQYLIELSRGEYGTQYFDRRARIGKIHQLLGLEPKFYLGMYAVYFEELTGAIVSDAKQALESAAHEGGAGGPLEEGRHDRDSVQGGDGPESQSDGETHPRSEPADEPLVPLSSALEAIEAVGDRTNALQKIMNLDQQAAIDTYHHACMSRVETELEYRESMRQQIEAAVEDLRESAAEIDDRSDEIDALAGEQSTSMGEVATEISTLSASIEQIASSANAVSETAATARSATDAATDTSEEAIQSMERVQQAASTVSEDVQTLQEGVERIEELVTTIDDIADQTNLLALNASIEAATAGESGAGFAVVADEVKSLAEESKSEAATIEAVAERIQEDTETTVESLEIATEAIDDGVDRVESVVDDLDRIEEAIDDAATGIREVATATDDQAASTEEVAGTVDATMETADRIATLADDVAASSERQTELIDVIVQQVSSIPETS